MKRITLFLFYIFLSADLLAQSGITTFILVRHAEKADDGTSDPDLNEEGKDRAQRLGALLKESRIDAILSTNYKRTRNTVGPIATSKGVDMQLYESLKAADLVVLTKRYSGGAILISGHSGTIPGIANVLLGTEEFKTWEDGDYGNVLVVSIVEVGKGKVVRLRY